MDDCFFCMEGWMFMFYLVNHPINSLVFCAGKSTQLINWIGLPMYSEERLFTCEPTTALQK